jgi:hypothetical protein
MNETAIHLRKERPSGIPFPASFLSAQMSQRGSANRTLYAEDDDFTKPVAALIRDVAVAGRTAL